MTEDTFAKLAYRTERADPGFQPLTLMQKAALQAFANGMRHAESNPGAHTRNIEALVNKGLGSDILYLTCAYNLPNLANAIIAQDPNADPSLPGEDSFSALDVAREYAKDNIDFQPLLGLLESRAKRLEIPEKVPPTEEPSPINEADEPVTTEKPTDDMSIVQRAKQGMLNARTTTSEPPRPLSAAAQKMLNDMNPTRRQR